MDETKILFVDDEKNVLRSLQRLLMDDDYEILTALSGEEGLEMLDEHPDVPLIVSDFRMPGMNGVEFLKKVCEKLPHTIRIVLSGYADTAAVVSAINEGEIYKFIAKPWNDDELKLTFKKAIEIFNLQQENAELTEDLLHSNDELKTLNSSLESQVEERTASLVFQNKALVFSQNILHALPVGVVGLDPSGLIVQSNKMADEILSENGGSVTGMEIKNVLQGPVSELFADGGPSDLVNELALIKEHHFWIRSATMNAEDGQFGTIVTFVPTG